jgi:hypothetical protein
MSEKYIQEELPFGVVEPKYKKTRPAYPWDTQRVYGAKHLTERGLLGKDDVFRLFHKYWFDPYTESLVRRHIFFLFVREQFEVDLSYAEHPRLRAHVLRESMANVFMVWGQRPKKDLPMRSSGVRNTAPPKPYFKSDVDIADRFPSVRITPDGVAFLQRSWSGWILEYYSKQSKNDN